MTTVIVGEPPHEFQQLLERRRALGQDLYDEVWEGVLHVNPAPSGRHGMIDRQLAILLSEPTERAGLTATGPFNLGDPDDYRVPDAGLHRGWRDHVYYETAALVVEILSPGDESYEKLPFYAQHAVEEVVIVDPAAREVRWLTLQSGEYRPCERSALIDLSPRELAEKLEWRAEP